jgi:hypothetical protein
MIKQNSVEGQASSIDERYLFTMIMFALTFLILISAQMAYITNRLFLESQCISTDFLLRIGLNIDQWSSACVAIESLITTIQGIHFNETKSKQMAKYIVIIVLLMNIVTTIHGPIHRHLIDDENDETETRTWCIVTYSSKLQIFNRMINIFYFLTRRRTGIHNNESYRKILHKQFKEHRHLLISPIDDPSLFLIGYFISFMHLWLFSLCLFFHQKHTNNNFRRLRINY